MKSIFIYMDKTMSDKLRSLNENTIEGTSDKLRSQDETSRGTSEREFFLLFPTESPSISSISSNKKDNIGIILHKNEFGYYEHPETNLVFSKESKSVIGKQYYDGTIKPLSLSDVEICKSMNFLIQLQLSQPSLSSNNIHLQIPSETSRGTSEKLRSLSETSGGTSEKDKICSNIINNVLSEMSNGNRYISDQSIITDINENKSHNVSPGESPIEPELSKSLWNTEEDSESEYEIEEDGVTHPPLSHITNTELTSSEKDYKEKLIDLFVGKWYKKFEGKINITTYGLTNCKLKNIHGLEFYGYEIIYNPTTRDYLMEFYTVKSPDNIPSDDSDLFILQSGGKELKKVFSTLLDYMNKYIFCKHCGVIRQFDSYSEKYEKCDNCLLNDLLLIHRKKSEYCTICLESTKNYYTLHCGHKFHRACLSDLKVKMCPNCRRWINEEDEID